MDNQMRVKGKIKLIGETKSFAKITKRDLVLVTEEQYPQNLLIEFINDKTSLLDGQKNGNVVEVDINLKGREWTSPQGEVKYFNTIQGWNLKSELEPVTTADHSPDREDSDLPF
jgi:hypothetical protein